jgi:hypothetical protein
MLWGVPCPVQASGAVAQGGRVRRGVVCEMVVVEEEVVAGGLGRMVWVGLVGPGWTRQVGVLTVHKHLWVAMAGVYVIRMLFCVSVSV